MQLTSEVSQAITGGLYFVFENAEVPEEPSRHLHGQLFQLELNGVTTVELANDGREVLFDVLALEGSLGGQFVPIGIKFPVKNCKTR